MPAIRPYSAVAKDKLIPLATSLSGIIRAVAVVDNEVKIRIVERGRVERIISFVPVGRQIRPPLTKNITPKTRTQTRSLTVKAMATATPPSRATTPPARQVARTIFTTSSRNSVDENARNFFLPQNQLRKD